MQDAERDPKTELRRKFTGEVKSKYFFIEFNRDISTRHLLFMIDI